MQECNSIIENSTMSTPTRTMQYVNLGNSGLKVSRIILGCMTYGSPEVQSWILGEDEGKKHIKAAYDAGIIAFDTAGAYSSGLSEEILGKAIKEHNIPREEIVVMTKVYTPVTRQFDHMFFGPTIHLADKYGYVNQWGLSRKHIFESVKQSLKRLQLEYVDVLQVHRFDENTPISETMQALHDVVKAGYARYIGMSSCRAWEFHLMQNYAITHNLTPFISMQNHHNMLYREEEREMFPTLKHFGVGCIPWSPLARGNLCRPFAGNKDTERGQLDWMVNGYVKKDSQKEIVKRVEEIAKKRNIKMAQVAIAWTLSKDVITAPIVGTTSLENLMDLIAGVDIKLTGEEIKYLDELYEAQEVFGMY